MAFNFLLDGKRSCVGFNRIYWCLSSGYWMISFGFKHTSPTCFVKEELYVIINENLLDPLPTIAIKRRISVILYFCPMPEKQNTSWREDLHEIIYESNTPAGKLFDVALLVLILGSILVVILDSIASYHASYGHIFFILEWTFTGLFTIEYILRLLAINKPVRYVFSFLGLIDLLAIIPSYLSILLTGAQSLLVLRALRLLRIFRIFKLTHFLTEMEYLKTSIATSMKKISIFMLVVLTLVIILGSIMYLVENGENGFESIPDSIYWAIVTITTVGYGDISPATPLGKFIASVMMFIGYGIIAVPTGIITTDLAMAIRNKKPGHETCRACGREGHDRDAKHCKYCGAVL